MSTTSQPRPSTKLNTSSLPSNLSAAAGSSSTPLSPALHSTLTTALLSANSVPRIEAALTQELAASGWTANLRAYVTALVRSGECVSYADVMRRVNEGVMGPGVANGTASGRGAGSKVVNGDASVGSMRDGEIKIPVEVLRKAVKVVRTEVDKVCELRVDDVDDR